MQSLITFVGTGPEAGFSSTTGAEAVGLMPLL